MDRSPQARVKRIQGFLMPPCPASALPLPPLQPLQGGTPPPQRPLSIHLTLRKPNPQTPLGRQQLPPQAPARTRCQQARLVPALLLRHLPVCLQIRLPLVPVPVRPQHRPAGCQPSAVLTQLLRL